MKRVALRGVLSLAFVGAGVATASNADAAQDCQYYPHGNTFSFSNVGSNPQVWYCNGTIGEGVDTGPGASYLVQDQSSTTVSDTVSLESTSLNNIAIFGYTQNTGIAVAGMGGGATYGGYSYPPSGSYGVWGTSYGSDGVHGDVGNSANAVSGINSGSGNGVYGQGHTGVYGSGGAGAGVYATSTGWDGVHGQISVTTAAAVAGINTGSTGNSVGVYGQSSSSTGYGVSGVGGATGVYGSGSTYGVYGTGSDIGVYGYATANYAAAVYGNSAATTGGWGLYGICTGSNCDGVFGACNGSGCYAGYFSGNVYATGSVQQNSDIRLKKNVQPLAGALDQLLRLKGVTYEWNEPEKHGNQAGPQTGFIAQDVEKVFPGWVGTDKDGFKTLSVQQIEGLEVESIRTLKAENDLLRDRVAALETGRQPRISGFNLNGVGFGVGGLAVGLGLVVSRRKQQQERPARG